MKTFFSISVSWLQYATRVNLRGESREDLLGLKNEVLKDRRIMRGKVMPDLLKRAGLVKYEFTAKPWKYESEGAWHFVSLPIELTNEIRHNFRWQEEGWGRMKATAKIGNSEWETAIWFDTKHETYLLPLKTAIRKKESIELGKEVSVTLWVL